MIQSLTQFAGSVNHGVLTAANCRSSQVLAWSPIRSQAARSQIANVPATMIGARTSHAVVLGLIERGSGGGAPVGRRCRLVHRRPSPWLIGVMLMTHLARARSALGRAASGRPQ